MNIKQRETLKRIVSCINTDSINTRIYDNFRIFLTESLFMGKKDSGKVRYLGNDRRETKEILNVSLNRINKIKNYHKEYRIKNKDKFKLYRNKYYLNNREKLDKLQKEYRLKSDIKIKNRDRRIKYCLENKDKIKVYQKEYHLKNKEKKKECRLRNNIKKNFLKESCLYVDKGV